MNTLAVFLLKLVIASGILFFYYWLVLRDKKFHHYNRFFLLAAMIIPVFIPFLNFRLYGMDQPFPAALNNYSNAIDSDNTIRSHSLFAWGSFFYAIAISVSLVLLFILLSRINWIYKIKKRHVIIRMNGFNLIETELDQAPFSFFDNLFWRKSILMFDDNGRRIFLHELTHIRERHSYDKLFAQLMLCFFWMNPFYWLIQKELNVIHEFIADSKSIGDGDTKSFAKMVLRSYNHGSHLYPSHSFFNSSIKRRIIMLTTSRNAQYSYLRRVCALPIMLLIIILFSFKMVNAQTDPKLNPHDSVKIKKVSIHQKNDSVADVAITYLDANGNPAILNIAAGYSKNDSTKVGVLYDEESGEKREVSLAETREIVKQIIQDPPIEKVYFVDGSEYSAASIKKLDPQKIKTINIYNGDEAVKRYGSRAQKGVIVFTTK